MQNGHERLAAYLKRTKLNQGELAAQIGIHFTHLSKIMSGRRPGLATALKIEAETGIPVSAWLPRQRGKLARRRSAKSEATVLDKAESHA